MLTKVAYGAFSVAASTFAVGSAGAGGFAFGALKNKDEELALAGTVTLIMGIIVANAATNTAKLTFRQISKLPTTLPRGWSIKWVNHAATLTGFVAGNIFDSHSTHKGGA